MISMYSITPTIMPQTPSPLSSSANSVTVLPRATATSYPNPSSNTDAVRLVDETPDWESRVRAHARGRRPRKGLALLREMASGGQHKPTGLSIGAALACCAALGVARLGRELHAFMLRNPLEGLDARCAQTSLVRFYAECGEICIARKWFDRMPERDVVSWTVMLVAYAERKGYENELLSLFQDMLCSGVAPNRYTITAVLRGATIDQGEQLHANVIKMSWDSNPFVGSALLDLYAKNGVLGQAQLVFDRIENKDVVCYNCLISHYGRAQCMEGLLSVFHEMVFVGLAPNQSTCIGLLNGCANFGLIGLSKQFHAHTIIRGFGNDEIVQGITVNMYAKCGDLEAAHEAFNRTPSKKSVVAWNSMICGYGKHSNAEEALKLFDSMQLASVPPDYITFICLLSACSHSGLVNEGLRLFNLMVGAYKVPVRNEHYCCIVDLLGRAGMVHEAYKFISKNKLEFRASVWGALLSACRASGNVETGEIAAKRLFELEPDCSGSYVALANIFAANGRWNDATAIRELMDSREIRKHPGCSWIEIGGIVHKFRAREGEDHPGMEDVHSLCDSLNSSICDHPSPEIFFDVEDDCMQY